MAYDYESAIRGAISDTAFSSKNVRKPSKKKSSSSNSAAVVPTAKPSQNVLLSNISNKDIEKMRISDFKKDRLIRDKRALDYAPGGKWEDNFVNKLLPGVNDKYSLLSNDQLADWYSSRGLEPKDYSKPGNIITGVLKFTPGNIIRTILSGDKKDDIVENTPTIDESQQTPEELFNFAQNMSRSVKDAAASSDDGFISGLLNVANDMRSIEPTPGRSFDQPYTSSLPTSRTDSMVDYQNRFPSLLLGSGVNVPRDNFDIPTEMPVVEEVTPPSLPYMDYLPLIDAANVGQDYTTMIRPEVDFRLGISPMNKILFVGDKNQEMLDNLNSGLLAGYNVELDQGLGRQYGNMTLENPLEYKAYQESDGKIGSPPQFTNASAQLLGYTPAADGVGDNIIPYYDMTYGQQLDYQQMMQDLRDRAAQNNLQLNLLGY